MQSVLIISNGMLLLHCPSLLLPQTDSAFEQLYLHMGTIQEFSLSCRYADIFEGCSSVCYAQGLLRHGNYNHLNLCASYPELPYTTASHGNCASDNLTIKGHEVLIVWSLPYIYCCNTTTPNLLVTNFSRGDTLAALSKLSSSMFSHVTSSGCLLWMVWRSVNKQCNSEGCFEHYDTLMTCSLQIVLVFSFVSRRKFFFRWLVASSTVDSAHWFDPMFSW